MLDKIFVYNSEKHGVIFLNGPYSAEPIKLLKLYVDWYNNDFAPSEKIENHIEVDDFVFDYSRCPVDFYEEYKKSINNYGVSNGI